jgi:hypothetical protein
LTPPLRAAVEKAMAEVLRELSRLGRPGSPRTQPRRPEVWWEAQPEPA